MPNNLNTTTPGAGPSLQLRAYTPADEAEVIALWQACGLTRSWNNPQRDIARKLTEQPELFLLGHVGGQLVATAMVGFDGTRGWVHYLGVLPEAQGRGFGRQMMAAAEQALLARGCPKLNLQVRHDNAAVLAFYRQLGYQVDAVTSLGKRLIVD
jgi:ribosomal protein S18 acetylase RimI-like enzyme